MDWKFWKPEKHSDEPTANWPVDSHASLQHVLGLYERADVAPFSSWAAPGIEFSPDVRGVAQAGSRGYQLALYFWLFAEKHGALAARMARESFCLFADAAHPGSGDSVDQLLDLHNRLAHTFETISEEQRTFEQDGLTVTLPMEFFLASAYFKLAPNSPYAGDNSSDMHGDDYMLAACFRHATEQALSVFRPLIHAVEFSAASLPNWKWSVQAGAAERHLQRRHNNPLFPLHRQMVTASDVHEARVADNRALQDIRHELSALGREFYSTSDLPLNWRSFLDDFRERLDILEDRRLIAGGANDGLGDAISELRQDVLSAWRGAIQKNRQSLTALDREEAQKAARRAILVGSDWTAQLFSQGSLIPPDEVVPALLSEAPVEFERAVTCMQADPRLHETLANCRVSARRLVESLRAAGNEVPQISEKLRMLDGTPGQVPA
ncbi:hypothetical protein CBA19CS11_36370 [Caballeronia novacaledonica]|uniref:tryptophan leader peptide n=1 Tax=Caballeronia novacaledonica TaxID=1544861 RepID=UPI001EE392E8|nr:tryptophan leader peptide [Caballeronia novacaledonica]GJH14434.1 hypothetical protein CBA19CS11_36370 [Caballeronia novacaledonica]